jgi:ATP-dependent Clp protease ATP-binding subunit ClpA
MPLAEGGPFPLPIDTFTASAQRAIEIAKQRARRERADVTAIHLLIGVGESGGVASRILGGLGVRTDQLAKASSASPLSTYLEVRGVYETALRLARESSASRIGTQHFLSALISDKRSSAVAALRAAGVEPAAISSELTRVLSQPDSGEP